MIPLLHSIGWALLTFIASLLMFVFFAGILAALANDRNFAMWGRASTALALLTALAVFLITL
jgi:hypothetical protein